MKKNKKRIPEFRANLKGLVEQRNDKAAEMQALLDTAKAETRAMTEEEMTKFNDLEKEITNIDATIKAEERARDINLNVIDPKKKEELRAEEAEERAFANYIRGVVEERADVNLTKGDNGAVIPTSIANKIITKVLDMCPIYQLATRYDIGGTLTIPYYDESTQSITVTYADEFTAGESTSAKTANISLTGFLARALSKVSNSLKNNSNFNIVNFVINDMSKKLAQWIEKELLNGTTNKIAGLSTVTQSVTAASQTAVTADELIDVQETIPDIYQSSSIWIMNKETRKAIRKLKDGQGNYLLNKDATAKWGYTLFGNDVYTSANMSTMTAGKTVIYYGDMSGLAVKVSEEINIQVLTEKYADEHATGVLGFVECDSKVEDAQKIVKLVMKAAA